MNSLKSFELFKKKELVWPLSVLDLSNFVTWALTEKSLKATTVITYLSSLKSVHALRFLPTTSFDSPYIEALIRGGQNLEIYKENVKLTRKVMSLPILKILGHEISESLWSENSKQVFWTACTTAFFGSFRLGEILPTKENSFSPDDTLLWKDIKFVSKNHVLIHIKSCKTKTVGGEYVDIFSFPGQGVCPVKALSKLKESSKSDSDSPVFSFNSGVGLTLRSLNSTLRSLLEPKLGEESKQFSGHSFRAGIPAALARHPELTSSDEIMGWGRWKSTAYLSYTRLKVDQRRKVFNKIATVLNNSS